MPAQGTPQWMQVDSRNRTILVRFPAPVMLTGEKAEEASSYLDQLVDEPDGGRLILNLRNVEVVTSLIIGKLFGIHRKAILAGKRMVLCEVSPVIREIFEVTRLTTVVDLYDTEVEAEQAK